MSPPFFSPSCVRHGVFSAFFRRFIASLFFFAVTGASWAQIPEIQLELTGGVIVPDAGTVPFNLVEVGSSSTKTLTVRNVGQAVLTNLSITKTGTNANDFIVSPLGTTSLSPGTSANFIVEFSPSQSGGRTAAIHIASNDANENPYDINLSGQGTLPEISVSQGSGSLEDGVSTVNFGRVNVGTSSQRTFTIRNVGTGTLTGLSVSVSGNVFMAGNLQAATLASGSTMSLVVTFKPAGAFESTGSLRIFSSDLDESPFDITLAGTGSIAWLEVEYPAGTGLVSEFSTVDFDTGAQGESTSRTFTIRNAGTRALTGLTVAKNGSHSSDFGFTQPAAVSIAAGATTTFTVTFTPSGAGERTAAVLVSSNETFFDTPFTVFLKGTSGGSGDASDPDGDGVPSLVEYATGTDPLVFSPPPGVLTKNGDFLEYTFTRLKSVVNTMSFTLDYSDNLEGPWNSLGANDLTFVSDDGVSQVVKFTLLAGEGRRFVRLRVTRL